MLEFETDSVVLALIALGLCSAAAVSVLHLFRILNALIADRRQVVEVELESALPWHSV